MRDIIESQEIREFQLTTRIVELPIVELINVNAVWEERFPMCVIESRIAASFLDDSRFPSLAMSKRVNNPNDSQNAKAKGEIDEQ